MTLLRRYLDAAGHNFGFSPNITEYAETLNNIVWYY